MRTLDNIPRVSRPSFQDFRDNHLARHEPVIITDLFAAQPIGELSTVEAFRRRHGQVRIGVTDEFFPLFLESGMVKPPLSAGGGYQWTTVEEYVAAGSAGAPRRMCSELPTPIELADAFEVPDLCDLHYREEEGVKSMIFLGHSGCVAHLHFDGDHHHVLFHQVFGNKRATLFPPRVSKRLSPCIHWSLVCLEEMSDRERTRFMEYGEARDTLLQPGETLYIPPLFWHHLDYVDLGLSLNLRFGPSPRLGFLSGLIPEMHVQNVASRLLQMEMTGEAPAALDAAVEALRGRCQERSATPLMKFRAIEAELVRLYESLCTDSVQGFYAAPPEATVEQNLRALLGEKPVYANDTRPA